MSGSSSFNTTSTSFDLLLFFFGRSSSSVLWRTLELRFLEGASVFGGILEFFLFGLGSEDSDAEPEPESLLLGGVGSLFFVLDLLGFSSS